MIAEKPTVVLRWEEELADLAARLERAEAFSTTETWKCLPDIERTLFREQIAHMRGYKIALEDRLTLIKARLGL